MKFENAEWTYGLNITLTTILFGAGAYLDRVWLCIAAFLWFVLMGFVGSEPDRKEPDK